MPNRSVALAVHVRRRSLTRRQRRRLNHLWSKPLPTTPSRPRLNVLPGHARPRPQKYRRAKQKGSAGSLFFSEDQARSDDVEQLAAQGFGFALAAGAPDPVRLAVR